MVACTLVGLNRFAAAAAAATLFTLRLGGVNNDEIIWKKALLFYRVS
jgi:hypothetical protein